MPKGGELHAHLSGTPTPQRLLELAAQSKLYSYFVRVPAQTFAPDDPKAYALMGVRAGAAAPSEANATFVPVATFLNVKTKAQAEQLAAFGRAQTISETEANPNNVFFNAIFARREDVTGNTEFVPQFVVDAMQQAQRDRVSYLELMLSSFAAYTDDSQTSRGVVTDLTRAQQYLSSLYSTVEKFNQSLPARTARGSSIHAIFLPHPCKTFSQLPVAFELAAGEDAVANAIAGINLVGNEYSEEYPNRPRDSSNRRCRRFYPHPASRLSYRAAIYPRWRKHQMGVAYPRLSFDGSRAHRTWY